MYIVWITIQRLQKPLPETDYKVTFNADNRGFTVKFLRDILPSDNIRIMYDVTLGKTPPNGTLYHNNSKLEGEVVTEGLMIMVAK